MAFAIQPNQTVLFTGDSITDCGRRGPHSPFGAGYVHQCIDLITARYPDYGLKFINTGIGGNTTRDVKNRLTDDVINHKPDWVSCMLGINDMSRWMRQLDTSVSPEEFREYYDHILGRIRNEARAQIILLDPFFISTDTSDPAQSHRAKVNKELPTYIAIVHEMVEKYEARHVQTHEVFRDLLKHYPADRFCPEPVHPNPTGHLAMAHAWLKAMGW